MPTIPMSPCARAKRWNGWRRRWSIRGNEFQRETASDWEAIFRTRESRLLAPRLHHVDDLTGCLEASFTFRSHERAAQFGDHHRGWVDLQRDRGRGRRQHFARQWLHLRII